VRSVFGVPFRFWKVSHAAKLNSGDFSEKVLDDRSGYRECPVYAYGILGNTVLFEEKQTQGPSVLLAG
jgi:hypothetical protein